MAPKKQPPPKKPSPPPPVRRDLAPAAKSKQEMLYPLIGKARVAFIKAARKLDELLKEEYGQEMTISRFEKILVEIRGHPELKDKLALDDNTLQHFATYVEAKQRSVDELAMFRQSYHTTPVQCVQGITKIDDLFKTG